MTPLASEVIFKMMTVTMIPGPTALWVMLSLGRRELGRRVRSVGRLLPQSFRRPLFLHNLKPLGLFHLEC